MVTDKIDTEEGNSPGSGTPASSEPRASVENAIAGELLNTAVLFLSLHRVERTRMDGPEANLSSLSQRFRSPTGLNPHHSRAQAAARAEGGRAGA